MKDLPEIPNIQEILVRAIARIEEKVDQMDEKLNQVLRETGDLDWLCQYLDRDKSWVYKKTSAKEIPFHKMGKYIFFYRTEIDEWLLDPVGFMKKWEQSRNLEVQQSRIRQL